MLTVAQLAWIIAFVGSVIGSLHGEFPNYTWWALVYFFCCIVGVIIVVGSESEDTYHVAVRSPRLAPRTIPYLILEQVSSYLAAGLVFTSSAVNATVYQNDSAKEAAAAGYILLSMVAVSSR